MPLGFERINERTQRPNALINFIRTLPGPSATTAEQILSRVAAVCYPFMKANMILVQALEEFPYNNEFVGRNFNAGEVIQLVLRDRNGRWLPQRMVEMVMVHELAHCKQMNHSMAFWKVRDAYVVELRALWARGYTGEGMWGRGQGLETGELHTSQVHVGDVPENLCGGTYGRRAKKRGRGGKEKEILSYAERKQRRILRKFGAGGQALGSDEDIKAKLEGGAPKKGKPRVADSARGRDLRAAAALARFDTAKKEDTAVKDEPADSESETDDEFDNTVEAAIDVNGKKMVDEKGYALVKICEEEDHDGNAKREMDEIQDIKPEQDIENSQTSEFFSIRSPQSPAKRNIAQADIRARRAPSATVAEQDKACKSPEPQRNANSDLRDYTVSSSSTPGVSCNVCSLDNEAGSLICAVCSNVLGQNFIPNSWKCKSSACQGSQYINSGDAGRCGVCGSRK